MAKIALVETGFALIPEGWYIFKITEATYNEDFGKIEVKMTTKDGKKFTERFSLLTKTGKVNEGAIKAFSWFSRVALNNNDVEEIDVEDLVGCYIKAQIEHEESETISEKTGLPFVNARLTEKQSAVGFNDKVSAAKSKKAAPVVEEDDVDLDDLDDLDDL